MGQAMNSFLSSPIVFDIALVLGTTLASLNMLNMGKPVKIVFMLFLVFYPIVHVFSSHTMAFQFGMMSWTLFIKCYKSFNVDYKDVFDNVFHTLKDLRLKGYDMKKGKELEQGHHYLSKQWEVIRLMPRYGLFALALIYINHAFKDQLDYDYIRTFSGVEYLLRKMVYAFCSGMVFSCGIQFTFLCLSLLYIHLSTVTMALSKIISQKRISKMLHQVANEVGDQRPYEIFNKPYAIFGVGKFWSESWHKLLRDVFVIFPKNVYKKATKPVQLMIVLSAFIMSGIHHDFANSVTSKHFSYSSLLFFSIQALAVIFEKIVFRLLIAQHTQIGRLFGIIFGNLILIYSCHLFIEPPKQMGIFEEIYNSSFAIPLEWVSTLG